MNFDAMHWAGSRGRDIAVDGSRGNSRYDSWWRTKAVVSSSQVLLHMQRVPLCGGHGLL
jgi:hypothetical protein